MLEWSPLAYWLTMRFVPGAVNRWRACTHLKFITEKNLEILCTRRQLRETLPIPHSRINRRFRYLEEEDLKTIAVDLVARSLESKQRCRPS
jgi:hypothetical protein